MKTRTKRMRIDSVDKDEKADRAVAAAASASSPSASASASSAATRVARATTAPSATSKPCKNALLVVSTYHGVMAGLVYRKDKFYIKFSVKRHVGRVNGTAVTGHYIASSGVDERIFLFTNKAEERLTAAARKKMKAAGEPLAIRLADLGSIAAPTEVTALAFADSSQMLLCGCTDGQLLIYRSRDWSLVTTLTVHEKAVVGLAVHPGSHGALAVTVGEDRAIAVLDLIKAKLLTKWKYNATVATAGEDAKTGGDEAEAPSDVPRRVAAPARETPVCVLFSPKGSRLIIFSRFSFVVYDVAVMHPLCAFCCEKPQPPDEIHCCAFYTEELLVLGTEAGALKRFTICGTVEQPAQAVAPLSNVEVAYPAAVAAQAAELLAGPVRFEAETRQKNPLRHVNRIKALLVEGDTLFSIDSSGIVIAWNVQTGSAAAPQRLQYVASANCQGRVTGMELYAL